MPPRRDRLITAALVTADCRLSALGLLGIRRWPRPTTHQRPPPAGRSGASRSRTPSRPAMTWVTCCGTTPTRWFARNSHAHSRLTKYRTCGHINKSHEESHALLKMFMRKNVIMKMNCRGLGVLPYRTGTGLLFASWQTCGREWIPSRRRQQGGANRRWSCE